MWAQLVKMRLKPEREADLPKVYEHLRAAEQAGSGLLRTVAMRDDADPNQIYNIVIFESVEKARQREQDPRRQERLQAARDLMGEIFEGPPEFVDLTVIEDTSY